MEIFKCDVCGNVVELITNGSGKMVCCDQDMKKLVPCSTDGTKEKHVPKITLTDCKVKVEIGSEPHPMMDEHYIEWIALETDKGIYRKTLKPGMSPEAEFILLKDEKICCAYEYCNIHGLWKSDF